MEQKELVAATLLRIAYDLAIAELFPKNPAEFSPNRTYTPEQISQQAARFFGTVLNDHHLMCKRLD